MEKIIPISFNTGTAGLFRLTRTADDKIFVPAAKVNDFIRNQQNDPLTIIKLKKFRGL